MNRIPLLCLLGCLPFTLGAQTEGARQADFIATPTGGAVHFEPVLPPLRQIAGAPPAFYDHYWEFGDGDFSFEEKPTHVYPAAGNYEVYYLATGKYDNGKAPRSRKKSTAAPPPKEAVADIHHALPAGDAAIGLKAVRNPRGGEEFVCVLSYANPTPVAQDGRLWLFYNEKNWKTSHFTFLESRTPFGEVEEPEPLAALPPPQLDAWAGTSDPTDLYSIALPPRFPQQALEELKNQYREARAWRFGGLQPGQVRNLFISLQATEEMVRDTNAIIHLSGLYISNDQRIVEQFDLEIEIVASHDPNYMAVSRRRMGFRRIRQKSLTYKVHFQNTGEGPASRVEVSCTVPRGLDAYSVRLLDLQPKCPICPDSTATFSCLDTTLLDDRIVFTFRNVYLPGTRQSGVSDRDSTKGFVKYRIEPGRRIRKQDFAARASIVFDKNPPIRTNRAPTRFRPGLTPAPVVGRAFLPESDGSDYWQAGLLLAPYRPYRFFWQGEVWWAAPSKSSSFDEFTLDTSRFDVIISPTGQVFDVRIDSITAFQVEHIAKTERYSLVPLQLRLNIAAFLSIGAGGQVDLQRQTITARQTWQSTVRVIDLETGEILPQYSSDYPEQTSESSKSQWSWHASAFADLHVGSVRVGPAIGLRAVVPLEGDRKPWLLAVAYWKF
ncbi:MAG: hypothetical protein KatS3mg030_283 [Saprospiraceae bacterium]|nr:MAG: hypothetical protein KatS3mg030_283 [Saprospiraceae bacterium]